MRILLDYRPALRARTGVGEFVHELARALVHGAAAHGDQVRLFTSSWKDRPDASLAVEMAGADVVDRRVPVRALAWAWNNLQWPAVENLAGACDVAHASGALLLPARRAAQVITVHDLDVLSHPERAAAEMQRDFPRHLRTHARRADHILVPSHHVAREVVSVLDVPAAKVTVCGLGAPAWAGDVRAARARRGTGSTILFVGTVEARKNVRGLIEAYRLLAASHADAPALTIAGGLADPAAAGLDGRAPSVSGGRVDVLGYVPAAAKPDLYANARMLVLPSFDEGFGLPVLEAMACGVPVVVSNRGALPEVAGDAAAPVDPADTGALAAAMAALLDAPAAEAAARRGLARAAQYSWAACAAAARRAYAAAIAHRDSR